MHVLWVMRLDADAEYAGLWADADAAQRAADDIMDDDPTVIGCTWESELPERGTVEGPGDYAAPRQPTYAEMGATGSWCCGIGHSRECTCAVAPGVATIEGL
jgi:hypothetical protein